MKAYTDIKQSKKLADILPHITADNTYERVVIAGCNFDIPEERQYVHRDTSFSFFSGIGVPCWSLAALLNLVKYNTINLHYNDVRNDWIASCTVEHSTRYGSGRALNPVDACYKMVLKLHEQKLL